MPKLQCPACGIKFKSQFLPLFKDPETGKEYYACPNQKQKCRNRIVVEPENKPNDRPTKT